MSTAPRRSSCGWVASGAQNGSQRLNLWNFSGKMSPASAKSWLLGVDGRAQMSLLQRRRSGFGKQGLLSTKCYNHQPMISDKERLLIQETKAFGIDLDEI